MRVSINVGDSWRKPPANPMNRICAGLSFLHGRILCWILFHPRSGVADVEPERQERKEKQGNINLRSNYNMASEALLVILALIGIGIIVVGVLLVLQPARVEKKVVIRDGNDYWRHRTYYPGASYSHIPVRPILF